VIDELRASIARESEALRILEQLAGVETHPPVPALPAPVAREAKPPASEPRRAAPFQPAGEVAKRGRVEPEQVRDLHAQGLDDGAIGAQFGVSASAILQWRKKLGLTAVGKGGRNGAAPAAPTIERVNAAATIVRWLKERGTIISELEPGATWKVNGRDVIDRAGLLQMANRKRELAKLPPFEWEHGQ
jgi:hypothetical protein